MNGKSRAILWSILGVLCILYGLFVRRAGSGTLFFAFWIALGLCFAAAAVAARKELWKKLPRVVRIAAAGILIFLALLFLFVEALILSAFGKKGEPDLDYVMVLGAQVRESGPSVVLRYRLDKAAAYLSENEDTVCIVTGGQGYNEPFPEAQGMRDYLVSCGISPERILMESKSKNTVENMRFSMELFDPEKDSVGILTNNFHVFRAERLAKKAGIRNACGIAADTNVYYLPSNMVREFLAVIKDFLAGNI